MGDYEKTQLISGLLRVDYNHNLRQNDFTLFKIPKEKTFEVFISEGSLYVITPIGMVTKLE